MAFLFGSGANPNDFYHSEDEEDVVDEYDDLQSPSKEPAPSAVPPQEGWFDLHRIVCVESSSLTATPKEVLEWGGRHQNSDRLVPTRPDVSECSKWPAANDAERTHLVEMLAEHMRNPPSSTTTTNSSWYGYLKSFLTFSKATESDDEEWEQTDDEYVTGIQKQQKIPVGFDDPILNIDLTVAMAKELQQAIKRLEEPLVVPDFVKWCRSQQDEEEEQQQTSWSSLSDSDLDLLFEVLKQLQDVAMVDDDGIILGCSPSLSQTQREALVTLERIKTTVASTERQLEQWRESRTDLMKRAAAAGSSAQRSRIFQRVRLLDQHISTAEGRFTNLLQTQHALESASTTSATVQVLEESTFVWKSLQEETTVENIGEVMDDLHEELEQVRERNDVISASPEVDEDDLLGELEALTISSVDAGNAEKAGSIVDLKTGSPGDAIIEEAADEPMKEKEEGATTMDEDTGAMEPEADAHASISSTLVKM